MLFFFAFFSIEAIFVGTTNGEVFVCKQRPKIYITHTCEGWEIPCFQWKLRKTVFIAAENDRVYAISVSSSEVFIVFRSDISSFHFFFYLNYFRQMTRDESTIENNFRFSSILFSFSPTQYQYR